jgi:hypothetical protein
MNKAELLKELLNKVYKTAINENWWTKLRAKIDGSASRVEATNLTFDLLSSSTKKEIYEELKEFEKKPKAYIRMLKEL